MSIYRKIPERCRKIKVEIPISLRPWAYTATATSAVGHDLNVRLNVFSVKLILQ
jgi:hypothetical protein